MFPYSFTELFRLIHLLAGEQSDKSGIMDVVLAPQNVAGKPKKKLLDQVRDVMRLKQYSLRTERTYCDWIKRFIRFHGMRHPAEMGEVEMSEFLTDLARSKNVSAATQNQALSALLFLYKEVLRQKIGWLQNVERAKKPARRANPRRGE